MQRKGLELLQQQTEAKQAEIVTLKADISSLRIHIENKKEPLRSQFEIDTLKRDVRDLVNENLKLKANIKKSLWN